MTAWLKKWETRHAKLCQWVEGNLEETPSTLVARIFPRAIRCLRLVRARAVETHEDWVEAIRSPQGLAPIFLFAELDAHNSLN